MLRPLEKLAPAPASASRPVLLVLLLAGSLSSAVGTIVAPVFPEIVEQLQIAPRWAGVLVSTHTLTLALASPTLGLLADRIGGVRVLLPSLLAYALFGTWGGFADSAAVLLLSRALVGAASGGIAAGSIGMLSGLFDRDARSRIMGYATSALATATVIFPLLGGWLGLYHWRWAFALYLLSLPVALAAYWLLPAPTRHTKTVDLAQAQGLGKTLRQPAIAALLLALGLAAAIFYVVVVYAPLYLKSALDASTMLNGMALAARAIGAAIISAIGASRLAKRLGASLAIALGFSLMALSLATIPSLQVPALVLLAALIFGFGFGIVMPNFYSTLADSAPVQQQAGVLALGTGIASLGQFISPFLFGPIWETAGAGVFYAAAAIAGLAALASAWRHRG